MKAASKEIRQNKGSTVSKSDNASSELASAFIDAIEQLAGIEISAEALCSITKLSDRRHRQIAKDLGYFASPIKSRYQFLATLEGLFRYYREQNEYRRAWKEKIDEQKHRKLKLEADEREGLLTDTQRLADEIAPSLASFRDLVYQRLQNDMPLAMAGMDVPQGRIAGGRHAAELLKELQRVFRKWKI